MSYPIGPGGYGPQQPNPPAPGGQPPGYPGAPAAPAGRGLSFMLDIAVAALGVLSFLLGFAPYAKEGESSGDGLFSGKKDSINFFENMGVGVGAVGLALLLTAALIAAFGLLPRQSGNGPVVAALSLAGFATTLFLMFSITTGLDVGAGLILVLVTSFLQSGAAIGSLLASSGIIKPPAPRAYPPYPQGGYPPAPPGYGGGNPPVGYPPAG